MSNEMALWLALGSALVAVIYGLLTTTWVLGKPTGSEKMQKIAAAIQEGAQAYMNRQYSTIAVVGVVLFLVVGLALDWATAVGFAIGAVFSGMAGYIGLFVSVRANVRTAEAARQESERRYRSIYETAALACVVWDRDLRVQAWNRHAEEVFGWTEAEVLGRSFFDLIVPPEARARVVEAMMKADEETKAKLAAAAERAGKDKERAVAQAVKQALEEQAAKEGSNE